MSSAPAPVILFAYKRLPHTKITVEALQRNPEAKETDLWIFADGARSEADRAEMDETREYLRRIDGFRNIHLTERAENFGLSRSIITGVTEVLDKCGRAIIVEDDIRTAPSFLHYMNRALDHFEDDPRVQSVAAHGFPRHRLDVPEDYAYDVFACARASVWGWGTWRDRWLDVDWDMASAWKKRDKISDRALEMAGRDLRRFIDKQLAGKLNSWDIPWSYDHCLKQRLCITPVHSYVENIGLDGSGEHCGPTEEYRQDLDKAVAEPRFMEAAFVDPEIADHIRCCYKREPVLPREIKRLLRKAGLLKTSG